MRWTRGFASEGASTRPVAIARLQRKASSRNSSRPTTAGLGRGRDCGPKSNDTPLSLSSRTAMLAEIGAPPGGRLEGPGLNVSHQQARNGRSGLGPARHQAAARSPGTVAQVRHRDHAQQLDPEKAHPPLAPSPLTRPGREHSRLRPLLVDRIPRAQIRPPCCIAIRAPAAPSRIGEDIGDHDICDDVAASHFEDFAATPLRRVVPPLPRRRDRCPRQRHGARRASAQRSPIYRNRSRSRDRFPPAMLRSSHCSTGALLGLRSEPGPDRVQG